MGKETHLLASIIVMLLARFNRAYLRDSPSCEYLALFFLRGLFLIRKINQTPSKLSRLSFIMIDSHFVEARRTEEYAGDVAAASAGATCRRGSLAIALTAIQKAKEIDENTDRRKNHGRGKSCHESGGVWH